MPAFTFEKIAPPVHRGNAHQSQSSTSSSAHSSTPAKKYRNTIVQALGRFVDARAKRVDQAALTRRPQDLAKRELPK